MFLNDFDLDLGFLRGFPLTFGAKTSFSLLKRVNQKLKGGVNE
jgi:hypothetical protein